MKIIALLPFKNEAWVLPTYLSSVTHLADEIIGLDDGSTDDSVSILQTAGATVVSFPSPTDTPLAMSDRRQKLLELGRQAGGTHFIWLDADETFTTPFIKHGRALIENLRPGEKIIMDWLTLWKDPHVYRIDEGSVWSSNTKDVIVYDDPSYTFEKRFLSEGRTEGPNTEANTRKLGRSAGAILHFQFADFERFQWKQARYRVYELIKQPDHALLINRIYSITLDDPRAITAPLKKEWIEHIIFPNETGQQHNWYREDILSVFKTRGITFFEPLQIWHIQELRALFLMETGREPTPVIPTPTRFWKIATFVHRMLPQPVLRFLKLWR